MEESSEKRRDRLQAMRMAAAAASQAEPLASPSPSPYSTQPVRLSNPLAHPGGPSPSDRSPPVPRFDFYTDPMAAFSGDRRRTGTRPTGGGVGGGGGSHYSSPDNFSSPVRSPSPMPHPSHMSNAGPRNYHMPSPSATPPHQFQLNHAPDQTPWRSPIQFPSTFSGHGRAATPPNPGAWNRSGGSSGYGGSFPHNYSAGAAFGSTSPMSNPGNRGGSPHSRGRGWYQGRGGGSPSPGRNGGRGRGFNRGQDARYEPEHFYGRHMVEDPWRDLTPIVGNILVPRNGFAYWLPESISAKKAKVAPAETSVAFKSRSSLADCLALALEEANDA